MLGRIRLAFIGTRTIGGAGATITWEDWPYGLISRLTLRLNGSNELWSLPGTALHALRFLRNPAFEDLVDTFPGSVGGSNVVVPTGTYPVHLTWDIPIPVEQQWLGAALFLQSAAIDCELRVDTSTNAGVGTLAGVWIIEPTHYDVPYADDGALIVPDVGRLHAVNEVSATFSGTGDVEVPLIRSAGQLHRLLIQAEAAPGQRLRAHPAAPANRELAGLRIEYAGNQAPYTYSPASSLLSVNGEHYGAPLPFDYLCLDLVRENTVRDPIELQGVTDLRAIVTIGSGVTVTAGRVSLIQETLF